MTFELGDRTMTLLDRLRDAQTNTNLCTEAAAQLATLTARVAELEAERDEAVRRAAARADSLAGAEERLERTLLEYDELEKKLSRCNDRLAGLKALGDLWAKRADEWMSAPCDTWSKEAHQSIGRAYEIAAGELRAELEKA